METSVTVTSCVAAKSCWQKQSVQPVVTWLTHKFRFVAAFSVVFCGPAVTIRRAMDYSHYLYLRENVAQPLWLPEDTR